MSDLDTFDDRTIKRAREKFTDGKRGSGDDPIATHAKVAQDVMLGHLRSLISRAENKAYATNAGLQGETVGDDLIDPFLSYDENVAEIKAELGVEYRTYAQRERKNAIKDGQEQARRHARETLRENFAAIEAGQANELVQDITDEFSQEFVADVLGRERELAAKEPAGAPTPGQAEPEPEPEPATSERAEPVSPDPVPSPEPAEPVGSVQRIAQKIQTICLFVPFLLGHMLEGGETDPGPQPIPE